MAFNNAKSKDKQPEKEKGAKPDFTIRARQSPESDFFISIGSAWSIEVNGQPAFSVKLHAIPTNWEGSCLMLTPKTD